ncbi:MAG: flippase [Betaproteobacteria bacterium]|nr:flippase [Betaproteobacteria bacterium]
MDRIKQNALYLTLLQGMNYFLPLVTVVYLVRIFGPSDYGRLALSQAFIQFFVILVDYGFALSATRLVAQHRDEPVRVASVFRAVILAKLLLAVSALPVMLALALWVPSLRPNILLCIAFYMSVLGNVFLPGWLYQGFQRMGVLLWITALPRIFATVAILLVVKRDDQLIATAALLSAAPVVSGAAALAHCRRWLGLRPGRVAPHDVAEQFRAGWHVFLATAAGAVYTLSPTFVLGLVAPSAAVGYFAAAERLMRAAQNLLNPISQALYPYLARLFVDSRSDALRLLGRLLFLVLAGYGTLWLVCQIFPGELLGLIFGKSFGQAVGVLRILCLYPLISGINVISGTLYLVPLNKGTTLSRSVTAPTAVHVVVIYPLALYFGSLGVASLLVITEFLILGMRIRAARRTDAGDLKPLLLGFIHPFCKTPRTEIVR